MTNIKLLFLIIICINLFSCKNNDKTNSIDNNDTDNNYTELIEYLNNEREKIINSGLSKAVFFINLSEDNFIEAHKQFNSDRLDYFIAILEENETAKKEYYEKHHQHWWIYFKYDKALSFYDSIDSFDYFLFDRIGKKYPGIKVPVDFVKEYKMNYRLMINQDNIKDIQY
jgi:hypothetical protein